MLEEPATLAELVATLTDAYDDADPSVVEHDVAALLEELDGVGAVTKSFSRQEPGRSDGD